MSATAPHDAYMDKYDATFLEIKGAYDVYNIAGIEAAQSGGSFAGAKKDLRKRPERRGASDYPAGPGGSAHCHRRAGMYQRGCLEEYIHTASRIGGGCIAYLLDYKHRIGKNTGYDFSL